MRVALLEMGMQGEVRSLAALGQELARRGHTVRMWVNTRYVSDATGWGFEVVPWLGRLVTEEGTPTSNQRDRKGYVAAAKSFSRFLALVGDEMLEQSLVAAEWADVLVANAAIASAPFAAAAKRKPLCHARFMPLTPTRRFPHPLLPFPVPGWLNRFSYFAWYALLQSLGRPTVRAWSRRLRVSPACTEIPWTLRLHAYSRLLVSPPDDWPASERVTGFWHLEPGAWEPPAELRDFLQTSLPVVCVTMGGEFRPRDLRTLTMTLLEGALTNDVRVVLLTNAGRLPGAEAENLLCLDRAEHSWLFPRVSVVVHNMEIGTTHAAARAGAISVPLPWQLDQFYWARRARLSGAAVPSLDARKFSAEGLAGAIAQALENEALKRSARELSERMAAEHGTANAADCISNALAQMATPRSRIR